MALSSSYLTKMVSCLTRHYLSRPLLPNSRKFIHISVQKNYIVNSASFFPGKCMTLNCKWRFKNLYGPVCIRHYFNKTEIVKDVLLFKDKETKFYYFIGAFAFSQIIFWVFLTHTAFTTMRDTQSHELVKYGPEGAPPEIKNWSSWSGIQMNLGSKVWRYGITLLSICTGCLAVGAALTFCKKSIHSLYLRKGGNNLTFVTYGFFGLRQAFTVSMANVSCQHSRHTLRTQLPLKVKGHRLYYILPIKEGKFYNGRLFDVTAGMNRRI